MTTISTISEFLLEAGTEYRIVDMGRGFKILDNQSFLEIENGLQQAPRPRQQMLWLGILFWNKSLSKQHFIWFIKLPLDERGNVVGAQRDQFLSIVIEALGSELLNDDSDKSLPDNPFLFTPNQSQLADFNSYARVLLGLKPGQYYAAAKNYIARPDLNDWQEVALQGLSDIIFNLNLEHNQQHIVQHFDSYAELVQTTLLASLENVTVPAELAEFLFGLLQKTRPEHKLFIPLLRALSQYSEKNKLRENLRALLENKLSSGDHLIVLAGRHWGLCEDYEFLTVFMEEAARLNLLPALYADLVQIPSLRDIMLRRLRDPQRSETLAQGINQLFGRA
ncbi:DUF3549 family protein [Planctobacterium marinum]|uniref:DUF3549 domain-containing protein n=1 Tax=Planctobacterium marinum TaxID=1631968 RepID=A0AA48HJL3_9ALTE|nr:hypothetical protein MACH26_31470 [Planctobacterium marinum]